MKRLLYAAFLAGAVIMVSFYGGSISYLLFYFAILLPVLALSYSLYVYFRFKIAQEMERNVTKAQKVPYTLVLANEDFIPFTSIALNYFTDRVTVKEGREPEGRLCLLPGQKIQVDTKMYCKYRGTYAAGVKSVSVTDFLGLFTITYPMREQLRVTVKPRIIPFERLSASLRKQDPKNSLFSVSKKQELPDFEVRGYQPGDPPRLIHWKNSARAGELLVRKQMPEEMFEIVVLMDLFPVEGEGEERLQTEDTVIEAAVSFVHHYFMKRIPIKVVYMEKELTELLVNSQRGFDTFYNLCPNLSFASPLPVEQVWSGYAGRTLQSGTVVLITPRVTDGLRRKLEETKRTGREAVLIHTGELRL